MAHGILTIFRGWFIVLGEGRESKETKGKDGAEWGLGAKGCKSGKRSRQTQGDKTGSYYLATDRSQAKRRNALTFYPTLPRPCKANWRALLSVGDTLWCKEHATCAGHCSPNLPAAKPR